MKYINKKDEMNQNKIIQLLFNNIKIKQNKLIKRYKKI